MIIMDLIIIFLLLINNLVDEAQSTKGTEKYLHYNSHVLNLLGKDKILHLQQLFTVLV